MMIRPGIRRLFRLALRRSWLLAEDVDDEIRLHLELRAEQLARRGLPADAARDEARRRFGPPDEARRHLIRAARQREGVMARGEWLEAVWSDLRYAARSLRRAPGLAAVVVITMALGLGANAAMFGVADRLLLRGPAHVRDAGGLVRVYVTERFPALGGDHTSDHLSYVLYAALRDHARAFAGVGAYAEAQATIGRGAEVAKVNAGYATADFFALLGVRPRLGRFFGADEDRPPRGENVAVLDYGLWQRRFAGDPGALGRTIVFGDEPYTIIGVAPEGFTGAEFKHVDLWLPMSVRGSRVTDDWTTAWNVSFLQVVGRLRPGVGPAQADADATALLERTHSGPRNGAQRVTLSVAPLSYDPRGKEPKEVAIARWLVGVAAVVLLIACANVANLLLARGLRRRREIAVRLALGIGRGRLVRLLLAEGLLLALAGGAAGLLLAYWAGLLIRHALLPEVAWDRSPVDARVLAFAAVTALTTGVLVGLLPALRVSRPDLTDALKSGAREGGGRSSRLRTTLTVAQVALSVVLLVGTGLFVRSLWRVRALDLGMQPDRVLVATVTQMRPAAPGDMSADIERGKTLYQRALERVARLPSVERASVAVGAPFQSAFSVGLQVSGRDSIPNLPGGGPYISAVTGDYFATMGTRVLRGRALLPDEGRTSDRVAVVNETMAKTLWPGRDAVGQCLFINNMPCSRVVGVVQDARRFRLLEEPAMHYYVPLGQESGIGGNTLLVRPRCVRRGCDPRAAIPLVRRELQRLDPSVLVAEVTLLQDAIDPQVRPWQLGATMFGIFGALALAVAAIGLYSLISYGVTQRAHEMGVRVALGAQRGDILRLVAGDGLRIAALGLALGASAALAAGRVAAPLLFNVSPADGATYAAVTFILLAVSTAASVIPARRATRVDPAAVLRAE